jgi:hypothetical protein
MAPVARAKEVQRHCPAGPWGPLLLAPCCVADDEMRRVCDESGARRPTGWRSASLPLSASSSCCWKSTVPILLVDEPESNNSFGNRTVRCSLAAAVPGGDGGQGLDCRPVYTEYRAVAGNRRGIRTVGAATIKLALTGLQVSSATMQDGLSVCTKVPRGPAQARSR